MSEKAAKPLRNPGELSIKTTLKMTRKCSLEAKYKELAQDINTVLYAFIFF